MAYKRLGHYITEYSEKNKERRGYPVYSVTNSRGFCTEYFSKDITGEDKSNYKIVPHGYFAYNPSRINVGSVDWQNCEENVLVSPLYVIFKCTDELNRDYLKYFLKSQEGKHLIASKVSGSVRNNLKFNALSEFEFNIGSVEEQLNIVTKLKKVEQAIENEKHQIELFNELLNSMFIETFGDTVENPMGWEEHRLEEYIVLLTSGSRGWSKYFTDEENELFITIKNVKNNHITLEEIQYVNAPTNKEAERTRVKEGDLLISITADLGRTGVVDFAIAERGAYINQHLSLVRLKQDDISPLYVSYFLETEGGKRQFESKNQTGVKAGLNFDAIKSLKILVPPKEKQEEYLCFVQRIDEAKKESQHRIALYEELMGKMISKYYMD